jgi:hypothetical protein
LGMVPPFCSSSDSSRSRCSKSSWGLETHGGLRSHNGREGFGWRGTAPGGSGIAFCAAISATCGPGVVQARSACMVRGPCTLGSAPAMALAPGRRSAAAWRLPWPRGSRAPAAPRRTPRGVLRQPGCTGCAAWLCHVLAARVAPTGMCTRDAMPGLAGRGGTTPASVPTERVAGSAEAAAGLAAGLPGGPAVGCPAACGQDQRVAAGAPSKQREKQGRESLGEKWGASTFFARAVELDWARFRSKRNFRSSASSDSPATPRESQRG